MGVRPLHSSRPEHSPSKSPYRKPVPFLLSEFVYSIFASYVILMRDCFVLAQVA